MPPNSFNKKHQKPLTSLEKLKKKKKQQLIQKATVKAQYYKTLAKEKPDLDAPDYVKEIFAEKTIDEDGNVVEYNTNKGTKRKAEEQTVEEEREYDLDEESSSSEEEDDEDERNNNKNKSTKKQKKQQDAEPKQFKPNPFKAQLEVQKRTKEEALKAREEKEKMYEEKNKARANYYRERNQVRGKMMAKNKRGQPNLATQMNVLLEKLQKQK
ncbi:hypothetical protein J3Q64DRAFT_1739524 [Phycomyces blakesleeanus]|uniref:rRNA-processing protein FYV7 n=2 Tax=Phycomyces blakesleeanus TaxID=4837 RepID=A0A163ASE1_PHYB8|nr:hypothetical protein PHYBLDRAFT_186412 [Phycomyces blakesleeanus NRRL 1555(-)]OAD75471.1 hypothetical protein PHYBLDRAFT_186412 [Phycomyces blakesleeanus NRRL 1555(-)]|eukprot:XP_018293511.1 hypothetical protein PHYBLDRAFT_186412 [Phycomyces blakesleeanus NRRL 1555(-)]